MESLKRKTRKGKDQCRVYCVAAHYGSFSVIKRCLCKRWKPFHPHPSDSTLTAHNSKHASCVAYFTGSKCFAEDWENRFGFWHCHVLVKLSIMTEHLLLSVFFIIHTGSVYTTLCSSCWLITPPYSFLLSPHPLSFCLSFRLCQRVHCGYRPELQGAEVGDSEWDPVPGLGISYSSWAQVRVRYTFYHNVK